MVVTALAAIVAVVVVTTVVAVTTIVVAVTTVVVAANLSEKLNGSYCSNAIAPISL